MHFGADFEEQTIEMEVSKQAQGSIVKALTFRAHIKCKDEKDRELYDRCIRWRQTYDDPEAAAAAAAEAAAAKRDKGKDRTMTMAQSFGAMSAVDHNDPSGMRQENFANSRAQTMAPGMATAVAATLLATEGSENSHEEKKGRLRGLFSRSKKEQPQYRTASMTSMSTNNPLKN